MPASLPRGSRHLRGRVLEVHDPSADLGDPVLGHDQRLAEAGVEALRDVAHQLEVLALVVAHRHLVGAVGEHVGRLEHRVGEQRRRRPARAAWRDFSLNWVMRLRSPYGGDRATAARSARCARARRSGGTGCSARVEPGGEQHRRQCRSTCSRSSRGVVGDRDRVQVDDAVDRLAAVLALDVLADRPDVVAEVLACRWAGCPLKMRTAPGGLGTVSSDRALKATGVGDRCRPR